MARKKFRSKLAEATIAYAFGDVLIPPAESKILPTQVDVSTRIGNINLSVPLISAGMDTVTEKEFAATIARIGGLGILHKNLSIDERVEHITWVKRRESGVIYEPITLRPNSTIKEARRIMNNYDISGIPILNKQKKLVGILTRRDVKYAKNLNRKVKKRMTPYNNLVVIEFREGISPSDYASLAEDLMDQHSIEKIPIIHPNQTLEGLITHADIDKVKRFPNATRDSNGRLRVGVAVGVSKEEINGVKRLLEAGADVICVDSAHGHSKGVIDAVRTIRKKYGSRFNFELIGGNVATYEGAIALIAAGASAVKSGIGPGSICTTRIIAGVGVPQLSAIEETYRAIYDSKKDISLIADGGIQASGDIVKALATGATTVMIGGLFAGVEETPGETILFQGRQNKYYRGMGSLGAMQKKGGQERYSQSDVSDTSKLVPEGVEGMVPYRGHLADQIHQLVGGLKSGMGYVGAKNLTKLQKRAKFVLVSNAGMVESHVHDITVTAEAPNYRLPEKK